MTKNAPLSLLLTAGNGPSECHQASARVLNQMRKEAEDHGCDLDVSAAPSKHGVKSAVIVVHGPNRQDFATRWCGTIRWRAKSQLRPNHKRTNWFVGVFPLPCAVVSTVKIEARDVAFESFRAGGPGGQHQNTTDSAVRAVHRPTGATAVAREMRSQHRNKALALERLQALMDAQAAADLDAQKSQQAKIHNALERGGAVRSFTGAEFREERRR